MRTTLNINDALLEELKARAAQEGRSFREVLEETLRLGLGAARGGGRTKRVRVRPHPLGLKPGFRGVSLNQLYDQIEAEEGLSQGSARRTGSSRVAEDPE